MPRECRTSGRRCPGRPGHGARGHPVGRRSARHALVAMAAGVVVAALSVAPAAASSAGSAGRGQAAPAQPMSIAITSISPTYATPKGKVTVSGTVTNTTAAAATGLSVQLWSSSVRLPDRAAMASYLTAPAGAAVDSPLPKSLRELPSVPAHSTRPWSLTLRVSQAGMTTFGVYPLAAQLSQFGAPVVDAARTFLPFWPAASQARTVRPVSLAWIWPLIDVPHRAACPALLNDSLAASLAGGGRLNQLLAVGGSAVGRSAGLTWAIDPALLNDAKVMTARYQVGGTVTCGHASTLPASAAARAWLSGVQSVAAQQDFFVTPYADVDVAALSHRGLTSELANAFADGRTEAKAILHGQVQRPPVAPGHDRAGAGATGPIAWPANGVADYGVLESLAASPNRIGTVILDSTMMPPAVPTNVTPTAVTTTPDGVYGQMHVLLADNGIGQVLSAPADSLPGIAPGTRPSPAAAVFARKQWFLAQTAMIASEAPHTARAVVVAPPSRWDPGAALASSLLDETVHTPWLRPASLSGLVAAPRQTGQVRRNGPPKYQVSRSELKAPLLRGVQQLNNQIGLLSSILVPAGPRYLSTAVAAVESSAWRGQPSGRRTARQLLRKVSAFVAVQQHQVRIINGRVTLGGKSGEVPVSIRNTLGQPVTVRLRVSVPSAGRVVIRNPKELITVAAGTQKTIKIPVKASEAGSTTLTLWLTNPAGRPLPGSTAQVTVEATHFGTMAIVIIGIALAVFVITAIGRAIRRGIRQPGGGDEGGAEGTATAAAAGDGTAAEDGDGTAVAGDGAAEPGPTGPDPAYSGPEADSVEREAGRSPAAKEPDEHASTPGWAERR